MLLVPASFCLDTRIITFSTWSFGNNQRVAPTSFAPHEVSGQIAEAFPPCIRLAMDRRPAG
jgi:hypothetical protein